MKNLNAILIVAFLVSCSASTELSEDDLSQIKQLEEDYVQGWFADDQQNAVLETFEDDAAFIPHHGDPTVIGKEKLRNFFWPDGIGR